MADMADFVVYNDATTPVAATFTPLESTPDSVWIEKSTTKSQLAKGRVSVSKQVQKNGIERRVLKLELPIMEVPTGADLAGNTASPKVAYVVPAQISVFVPQRATDADVANSIKMLVNVLMGDATAGTGDAYKNATNMARTFAIGGIKPD